MLQECKKYSVGVALKSAPVRPYSALARAGGPRVAGGGVGALAGAVLCGLGGLGGAPVTARAADVVLPGTLVQQIVGGKTWQACGTSDSVPCTAERGVVWLLPSAQVLGAEHKELPKLRLIVEDQRRAIGLLTERLSLAQEQRAKASDELLVVTDSLRLAAVEHQRLAQAAQDAQARLRVVRVRWFSLGAVSVIVAVVAGAAIGFAM